jgi:UDP-sulfoquinovose synthase
MRVLIAGIDGYLGWALAQHLATRGHDVSGCDNYMRRDWVAEVGSQSATPIPRMTERLQAFRSRYGRNVRFQRGSMTDYRFVWNLLRAVQPDAIVHLAEMASAPYSMIDVDHCVFTQTNNVVGTLNLLFGMREVCPEAHLVKLGTMGEYGTPNVDIPEGFFEIEYRGRKDTLPFPRQAGSWYHQTKVHDSNNIHFACRMWGLRSTDVMQGVVFGTRTEELGEDEQLLTRFDFDQCFGTAINRFCAQAVVGLPLTLYGAGHQRRGFLPLRDSVQCLRIAVEHPPQKSEYRVFNQFANVYDLETLASMVARAAAVHGIKAKVQRVENPRKEAESHYYNPDHKRLFELGYEPSHDIDKQIEEMVADLIRFKPRIEARSEAIMPDIRWDGSRRASRALEPGQPG